MIFIWSTVLVIGILVFVHELGHYLAARSVGVRVEKFSIGLPPRFITLTSVDNGFDITIFFFRFLKGSFSWKPIINTHINLNGRIMQFSGTQNPQQIYNWLALCHYFLGQYDEAENNIINFLCWLPYKYSKIILIFIFLIVSFILLFINKIDFDENRLNLQDPKNESVKTYQELLKDSSTSPWEGILIVESADQTNLKKNEIKLLPLVDNAISIHNLIPEEQNDKLIIIDEMSLLMGNLENRSSELEISKNHRIAAIKKLKTILDNYLVHNSDNQMILLNSNLNNLLSNLNDDDDKKIKAIENQFLENFPGRIKALSDALNAEEVTINNIPDEIYKRWVSDEKYLIKILPKEDLNNNISMRNFVYQLQDFNKDVIGSPIISIEAGNAVKSAFKFAFLCAFIAITILLMLLIKIKYDALIILISVLIGSIFTLGFMLFFNIPLNFANIIGLPLLLGIGVDSGIHITERFYEEKNTQTNIYITSSMKGVIISSLTTIFSIGNLAFSSHQGTASMGLLLSVGLISMMFATMIVLPSFLIWRDSSYK